MKFGKYLKDRLYSVCIFLFVLIVSVLMMCAFRVQRQLIIAEVFILVTFYVAIFLFEFLRKKEFYKELIKNIEVIDEKYFITEIMQKPGFYEGKIFTLMVHNHTENVTLMEHMNPQLRRINDYIEQILYYVRSENAEKDYIINDVKLSKITSAAAMRNKDDLLENNISFRVENTDTVVLTDSKWMEFMLNQIISNSIKYRDEKKQESYIKLRAIDEKKSTIFEIEDNGIGINKSDLPRVFDKSFTGENGHKYSKATGMGLYIVKKLCDKMGHGISIESVKGEYTTVIITFYKNDFYKEIV